MGATVNIAETDKNRCQDDNEQTNGSDDQLSGGGRTHVRWYGWRAIRGPAGCSGGGIAPDPSTVAVLVRPAVCRQASSLRPIRHLSVDLLL